MPVIKHIQELFDEPHEIMAWLTFTYGCTSAAFDWLDDGYATALIVVSLVVMRSLRLKSAGPSGFEFEGDK